jgi:membrane protein YdbS with pleckstrin-like domain
VFRRSLAWWTLIAVAIALVLRSFAPLALIAVGLPISMWYASMYVRYTRWALQPDALFFRYGCLTRKMIVVPRIRVQTVCLTESPFDRSHAMASVCVDTAGAGPRSDQLRIPYLERHVARELGLALYESSALESERELQAFDKVAPA